MMISKLNSTDRKPRIILLMQYFDPEPIYKGQEFAEAIYKAGYEVEVVTGFPNFPKGKVYPGHRIWPIKKTNQGGINVTRLALYPSHGKSKLGRVLNYVSFMVSAFLYLTFLARRANLVYVYHPPLTVGLAAAAARVIRRNPVVVDIHDLWPDTLPATGMITNTGVLKVVEMACNWMYRHVQHIILHSEGFREELLKRGVKAEKMTTVIGWTHEPTERATLPNIPKKMAAMQGLKVVYAGNVGPAQALDSVLDAAHILQLQGHSHTATFCILGSGISVDFLKSKACSLKLKNVVFVPRVNSEEVEHYIAAADVLLIHLRDTPLFELNIPSKTQAYMLAAKPILAGVGGHTAKLLDKACAGINVPPENPIAMADAVLSLAKMAADDRCKLGENARNYYWSELSMEQGMEKFIKIFKKTQRF